MTPAVAHARELLWLASLAALPWACLGVWLFARWIERKGWWRW